MIVVGIFVVIVVALMVSTVVALHLGFRAGDHPRDAELHRRIDTAATRRWQDLGRLSRLP